MLAQPLGHSQGVLLTWLKVIEFSSEHLSQPIAPSHTPAVASWVLWSSLACQDVIPVSLALLSVACVRGAWGLRAAVIELLINSKDFRNFLRVPSEKSGQNPGRSDLLSCSTGVLPAAGRHGSPGPGARETPGCGHPAGRGEAGPRGWELKSHQNRNLWGPLILALVKVLSSCPPPHWICPDPLSSLGCPILSTAHFLPFTVGWAEPVGQSEAGGPGCCRH